MLCDSNILIYAADPADTHCLPYAEDPDAVIASISRIKVLGFPRIHELPADHRASLYLVVESLPELSLDDDIIQRAIALRQQKKMSLGDAIVAASAPSCGMPLVTRNVADYKHISGLKLIDPFANH
jgi:toxin FitB